MKAPAARVTYCEKRSADAINLSTRRRIYRSRHQGSRVWIVRHHHSKLSGYVDWSRSRDVSG